MCVAFHFFETYNVDILHIDTKLPPRAAFTAQIFGTLLGSVLNFGPSFLYNNESQQHS